MNIYNTSGSNKASLTFTGSSDVTVDSNNLSGLTSNVQTQLGQMIGVGQTWQNVTASRALGTTYTNTTGKPIAVMVRGIGSAAGNFVSLDVVGVPAGQTGIQASGQYSALFSIVPNNASYAVNITAGTYTNIIWSELK